MKLTEQGVLHTSERGATALVIDENGREYVRKTGSFNTETLSRIAAIDSPFLVRLYDCSDAEIVMEYVSGSPLSALAVPASQLYEIICEICDGLSVLHNAGVIHRDIKPSNIMLTDYGHIKIIDFDAARIKKPEAEKDTSFIGTDGFAPPEQYGFTQTDERSDIYALGVTIKLMLKNNYERSPLRAVVEKCMRFDPGKRYSSAAKVKAAIIARRYHAVPIACAAVIIAGTILAFAFATNKQKTVPIISYSASISGTITAEPPETSLTTSDNTVSEPVETTTETTPSESVTTVTTTGTTELTTASATVSVTEEQIVTEATLTVTTTATEQLPVVDTEYQIPDIPFLPTGFPALPEGISKINDTDHIKKIEWEKLAQDDVSALIDNITKWLGESAEVDDKSTRMGRTIQWKCSDKNIYNGYIILLYVEDTEKNSMFPQCRLSFSTIETL